MKDIIKQNLNDEFYIQTVVERLVAQRNEANNTIVLLETEILKANSILQKILEENKDLKNRLTDKETN